ncbi:predicted protein [Chaetoceros tenuissimus]|uniref:RING-type domain-containing protein n=1 Tax=Chaetoceros tenuissimus TaxID=426638 RepID=A0AAD3D1W4_9STRA|nr:predicted protein [Chaetoceros tenuissimus]
MGNCICEISERESTKDAFIVVTNENTRGDQEESHTQKEEEGKQEEDSLIIATTDPEQKEKPNIASIECCICAEDMPDDHACIIKPGSCSHKFHVQCYQKLVDYNRRNHLDLRCPLCRTEFSFEPGPAAQALKSMFIDIIHSSEMPFHRYAYDTYHCPYSGKGTIYFAQVQSESITKGKSSSRKTGSYFGNPIKVADSDDVREKIIVVYTDVKLIDIFHSLRVNCPLAEHLFHDELISINDIDVTHMRWFQVNKMLRQTSGNNNIRKFTISRQELVQFHNYDIEDNLNDETRTAPDSIVDFDYFSMEQYEVDYHNDPDRYDYYALE